MRKGILRDEVQLPPALFEALNIIASWESWTLGYMCRMTLISLLESEYGEMLSIMEDPLRSKSERAWSRQHENALAPIMAKLGWDGNCIAPWESA